jgi:hypothetical protein
MMAHELTSPTPADEHCCTAAVACQGTAEQHQAQCKRCMQQAQPSSWPRHRRRGVCTLREGAAQQSSLTGASLSIHGWPVLEVHTNVAPRSERCRDLAMSMPPHPRLEGVLSGCRVASTWTSGLARSAEPVAARLQARTEGMRPLRLQRMSDGPSIQLVPTADAAPSRCSSCTMAMKVHLWASNLANTL